MNSAALDSAEKVVAELQMRDGEVVKTPAAITISASFSTVRTIVENSRPLRRPNRNKPVQCTTDAEISAWEAASDSSLRNCDFWE